VRRFVDIDQPAPAPANRREPRSRRHNRRFADQTRDGRPPTVEEERRRLRVEAAYAAHMLPHIVQNVHEGIPDFAAASSTRGHEISRPRRCHADAGRG
jgi:hypothetical protein